MELWIITGLIILIVFLYVALRRNRKTRPAVMSKEIEETLEAFIDEVGKQNEELLESVTEFKQQMEQRITDLEKKLSEFQALFQSIEQTVGTLEHSASHYTSKNNDQLSLQDRYSKVFELHGSGLSLEEIARITGSGKGEVELILQLSRYKQNN